MKKYEKSKFNIEDILLLLAILLQDAGGFGIFPINISQIIVVVMFIIIVFKRYRNNKTLFVPKIFVFLIIYIILITLCQLHDFDSIKSIIFFSLQLITFIFYIQSIDDVDRIKKILYLASFIISFYGIIQIVAFYLNLPMIYDLSNYGFIINGGMVGNNGFFRPRSFYSEPAHLCSIIAAGFFLGLAENTKEKMITKFRTLVIIIFGLLSTSVMVYLSMAIVLIVYMIFYQQNILKKAKYVFVALILVTIIISFNPKLYEMATNKFFTLFTASSTSTADLSGFATISNIKISIQKMKDGYILGTGFDSHRLYYMNYIHKFYDRVIMYLSYTDAGSLFTRIFSEFGIIGFLLFMFWMGKNFFNAIKSKNMDLLFFAMILFIQALRHGSYIYILATLPFAFCICQSKKVNNNRNVVM